jgi:transposase
MARLTDTMVADLQRGLDAVEGKKPALRLVAAIAYKHGVTQSELAEWLDVERRTIYNWFSCLEQEPLETAVRDGRRPGRPRKLSEEERDELRSVLRERPIESDVLAPWWTTDLVQEFIRDRYDVEYSASSCRRLMKAAGLEPIPPMEAMEATPERPNLALGDRPQFGHAWLPT